MRVHVRNDLGAANRHENCGYDLSISDFTKDIRDTAISTTQVVELRGNSHTTRTMRRRAVPDTKPWHCEPSPRTTSADIRENSPSLEGDSRCNLHLVAQSASALVRCRSSSTSCSCRARRLSRRDLTIRKMPAMRKVPRIFSRSIGSRREDISAFRVKKDSRYAKRYEQ